MDTVPKPGGYGFTIAAALARPFSRGSIRLKSKDPFDYPLIDPKYLSDKRDVQNLISAARVWEKIMQTTPYKKLGIREDEQKFSFCSEYEFRSDAYWECYIRNLAIATYHQSCTCKMGPLDSPTSVVDTQLRVKDSSVFPNVTSGNTNIPTVMVAERVADFIRGIHSVADIRKRIESLNLVVD
ncbi:DHGL-like protein [Mya arenaria]|uniref:DHGL-like protein n=1 Tax=Mya arenaria TaxID=6604 RepID=A0ABY7EV50_MYAAR|nr:DHGL-like protein [Mya arenaria]